MNFKYPWANKDLGQHFLINESVIEQICNNFFDETKGILEIGPGPGILTEFLSKTTAPFLVVEKDERFRPYLEKFIKPEQIIMKDALEVDLQKLLEENNFPKDNLWVVSNLPYNISVPLTLKFLSTPSLEKMTLMMQKEVAERIFPEGKKASKHQNVLRLIGYSYAPELMKFLLLIYPKLLQVISFGTFIWVIACQVLSIKAVFNFRSIWKCLGIVIFSYVVQIFLVVLLIFTIHSFFS